MAYTPTQWKDHIVETPNKYQQTTNGDGTVTLTKREGNVVQQGTAVSATNLNKMEQGIVEAHAQLDQTARVKQTLTHGVNVLNAAQNAPTNIEIEGRTLVPMQNTVLDATKYYVLADPKTKVKFADNTVLSGIAKFTGKAERPTIIRVANFGGKVASSTLENPHTVKTLGIAALKAPAEYTIEWTQTGYTSLNTLDGNYGSTSTNFSGQIAQHLFSFDLIAEIERNVGRIPRATVAEKVAWIKANVTRIVLNWYGFGSGPTGNKASVSVYQAGEWTPSTTNTASLPSALNVWTNTEAAINGRIQDNGFMHYVAYAEPSNGTILSIIASDYVELEIELKPTAILHDPRVPLYEVPKAHYDLINLTWSAEDTMKRYPSVSGPTHLQNPYIIAEGENLWPLFTNGYLQNNLLATDIKNVKPYEVNIIPSQYSAWIIVEVPVTPYQDYAFNADIPQGVTMAIYATDAQTSIAPYSPTARIFNVGNRTAVRVYFNMTNKVGTEVIIKNPMLTLGNQSKPFVPRNPSYLFVEATLGEVAGVKDLLYEQDGLFVVRKAVEKDVVLDGQLTWVMAGDREGFKRFYVNEFSATIDHKPLVVKHTGEVVPAGNSDILTDKVEFNTSLSKFHISVSDLQSGWLETQMPTASMIKAYFNGWKYTGNGTTHSWVSIVDGTTAPTTQTEAFVATNKAPNYTPYKISYVLQTPQIVPVKTEGAISVNGLTQVEVGSGVIVREKFTPQPSTTAGFYDLNLHLVPQSKTRHKIYDILAIYKNSSDVTNDWLIVAANAHPDTGLKRAYTTTPFVDLSAEYHVTYIVYNKQAFTTNPLNVTAQYANNIRGALEDTAKKVEDVKTETSINTNLLYDVLKRLKAGGL